MNTNQPTSTQSEIVDLLYNQTWRIAVAHPIGALIVVAWLYSVTPTTTLWTWFSVIIVFAAIRMALFFAYKKKLKSGPIANIKPWKNVWIGFSIATGLTYSYAFIEFVPVSSPEYILSIGLFIIGLSATAAVGYGASLLAIVSFFIPVVLPGAIHVAINGGETGLIVAASIGLYSFVVLSLIKSINNAFKRSINLNFQLKRAIEKRKVVEHQLQETSRRDGMTGLFNRRYFDEMLVTEIGRSFRNHSSLSLLLIDIDYFKNYNDYYGHVAGDKCLIEVADILLSLTNRKGDMLARYGGEEFAILLPNIDAHGAFAFAEKLQLTIQEAKIEHSTSKLTYLQSVTVSVGVTTLPPLTKINAEELIERADKALYEAKKDGRNRVKYFEAIDFDQDRV